MNKIYLALKKCEELLPLPIEKALDKIRLYSSYFIWHFFSTHRKYEMDYSKVKNIIIMNSVALGDNLIRTATVEAIARFHGKVDILIPNEQTKRVYEGNPYVKNIYTIDNPPQLKNYQLAVVINYDQRFMDLIKESDRIKEINTIGLPYVNPRKIFRINKVLFPKPYLNQMDNMLRLAKEVGSDLSHPIKTSFYLTPEDELNANKYLNEEGIKDFIVLNFGASNAHLEYSSRWWPDENWKAVIEYTLKKYPDMSIIINSGNARTDLFFKERVHYFNGDLGTLAALIKQAKMVVQLNTGVGHLAAAIGTPVITLIGFTDAGWAPWTRDGKSKVLSHPEVCTNCNNSYCKKKNRKCMTAITPEEVVVAMDKILEVKNE